MESRPAPARYSVAGVEASASIVIVGVGAVGSRGDGARLCGADPIIAVDLSGGVCIWRGNRCDMRYQYKQ
jgi:Zn-dependent alcohol dehydrogenase